MQVWNSINKWADVAPSSKALRNMTYKGLRDSINACIAGLPQLSGRRAGILITNRPLWGIYDISLTLKGATVVPIPTFFSNRQIEHIVKDASIDTLVVESRETLDRRGISDIFKDKDIIVADTSLELEDGRGNIGVDQLPALDPDRIAKIIYTSGTTGTPKGVLTTLASIEAVTNSLIKEAAPNQADRHLSILPLSTLIETIGGLYVPLIAGGSVAYLPPVDPASTSLYDKKGLKEALFREAPTTLNLVPDLLAALLDGVEGPSQIPSSLRFVACGGAPLPPYLEEKTGRLGIPLFQGYGLSECGSVVALNGLSGKRVGSVGKPLPHVRVEIDQHGEVFVTGSSVMRGYTNGEKSGLSRIGTGDIGRLDDEGFLYIKGRKDRVMVTSQGRNVSPEWIESEIRRSTAIRTVKVFNDAEHGITASVLPNEGWLAKVNDGIQDEAAVLKALKDEIDMVSEGLPVYARINHIILTRR